MQVYMRGNGSPRALPRRGPGAVTSRGDEQTYWPDRILNIFSIKGKPSSWEKWIIPGLQ